MGESAPPENLAVRLRLRRTFIDVDDSGSAGTPRRAHSEPRHPVQKRMESAEQDAYLQMLSRTCMAGPCPNLRGSSASEACITPRYCMAGAAGGGASAASVAGRSDYGGVGTLGEAQSSMLPNDDDQQSDNDSHEAVASDDSHSGCAPLWRSDEVAQVLAVTGNRTLLIMPRGRRLWGSIVGVPGGVFAVPPGPPTSSSAADALCVSACSSSSSADHTPLRAEAPDPLAAAVGRWRVTDGPMTGSVWTIEEDGRALFNGKRFGTKYDLQLEFGPPLSLRADCWTVNLDLSSSKMLVWNKTGDPNIVIWRRISEPIARRESKRERGKSGRKDAKLEQNMELQSKMQASAQRMSAGWGSEGRLSSAMAAIEEIPMRISEDMQRAASYYIDNMQSEVAAMSKQIRSGGTWRGVGCITGETHEVDGADHRVDTEQVIKNLEVIPTMVHNLLEARVEKARSKVRRRIRGVIQNLSAIKEERGEDADNEVLASKMRMISEEVEQIAGDAVRAAAQECHAHAVKQLDCALTALREGEPSEDDTAEGKRLRWSDMIGETAGGGGNPWCVTHDPEFWSKTVMGTSAKHSMEQFAAVVQDKGSIPHSFTNQVVADELLRARIRSGGGGNRGGATATLSGVQSSHGGGTTATPGNGAVVSNPGSRGHPDLCIRPCLYFAQGNCSNGNECAFCHLPHPKRPVRFDKLHRESLKRMTFGQFLSIILPVLKQKVRNLDLASDVAQCLEAVWTPLDSLVAAEGAIFDEGDQLIADCRGHSVSSSASASGSERSIRRGSIEGALRVMGFRSLLSMLVSKVPDDRPEVRAQLEQVVRLLHENTFLAHEETPASATSMNSEEVSGHHVSGDQRFTTYSVNAEAPSGCQAGSARGKPLASAQPAGDGAERRGYQVVAWRQPSFQNGHGWQKRWTDSSYHPGPRGYGHTATRPVGC
mmetsp:Transcript_77132/g.223220  ORF Transcript_77132/g.223220 Transcript_77132/m.223220 type:complete len:936 (-) Transcript_77132:33-2840(-)